MPFLTPYGRREWIAMTVLALLLGVPAAVMGWWWLAAPVGLLWLAGLMFFRDPPRRVPAGLPAGAMLSPADGRISAIERVPAHAAVEGEALVVRIFLSVLDVHVNRAPCAAEVVRLEHAPGRYLDARNPESARVNESNLMVLRVAGLGTIGVRQVSGAIARRIVCPVLPGALLRQGERYGMIKFGSTTELVLPRPDEVELRVAVGDRVRGGLTVLAVHRGMHG